VITVRPFNTFGPRQSARAVIPAIITQCLTGETVRLGNLHPTRDLNYVGNTVDGFIKAAAATAGIGQTVNLGSGREISIGDLAQLIAELTGQNIAIESDAQRLRPEGSEVDRLLADATRARELLGWQAEISLEDGLQKTIDWIQVNMDRYRPGVYSL
jgi:dTDP-glucose 4,6-dehydratase